MNLQKTLQWINALQLILPDNGEEFTMSLNKAEDFLACIRDNDLKVLDLLRTLIQTVED